MLRIAKMSLQSQLKIRNRLMTGYGKLLLRVSGFGTVPQMCEKILVCGSLNVISQPIT